MWDAFRRNMMYFIKLVENHNARISAIRFGSNNDLYYDSDYVVSLHNIHYAIFEFTKNSLRILGFFLDVIFDIVFINVELQRIFIK